MITHIKPSITCDDTFYVGPVITEKDGDQLRLLGPGRSDLDEGKLPG